LKVETTLTKNRRPPAMHREAMEKQGGLKEESKAPHLLATTHCRTWLQIEQRIKLDKVHDRIYKPKPTHIVALISNINISMLISSFWLFFFF
jgi:hypothetical protein